MLAMLLCWLFLILFAVALRARLFAAQHRQRFRTRRVHAHSLPPGSPGFPQKKPEWVRHAVLALQARLNLSHRKLADTFNQLYFASTGVSVGRTWVRDLLKKQAYDAPHLQRALKHLIPPPLPRNVIWGVDTTCVGDADRLQHVVLGMIDHGSRLNLALRQLKRFNAWTFLGCVFLAIGEFGKPKSIKMDNHPVLHAKWVKRVLRWIGVRQRFSRPNSPWENGFVEKMFGTLKSCLRGYVIRNGAHLALSLASFRLWYNLARSHQHLGGRTPHQVWHSIDPYARAPKIACLFTAWEGHLRGIVLRH